ncbi:MAG: hypothetical protein C0424_02335 [Sphingobacteriaceae bacterium]|nr:hypothetical protein [Sphingobacteriaceae bacterium]
MAASGYFYYCSWNISLASAMKSCGMRRDSGAFQPALLRSLVGVRRERTNSLAYTCKQLIRQFKPASAGFFLSLAALKSFILHHQ